MPSFKRAVTETLPVSPDICLAPCKIHKAEYNGHDLNLNQELVSS
jgi:hypothetical protein